MEFGHEGFAAQPVLERRQQGSSVVDERGHGRGAAAATCSDKRSAQRTAEAEEETTSTQETPLTARQRPPLRGARLEPRNPTRA